MQQDYEYEYRPRSKQRGRFGKEESGVTFQDGSTMESSFGLLLLLEACQRLDSFNADDKDVSPPAAAHVLERKTGTGRRKRSASTPPPSLPPPDEPKTDSFIEHKPQVVVHAHAPSIVQVEQPTAAAVVALSKNKKGRKELHGPCSHCGARCSPQWRKGPKCKPVLCNACGIRFLRTRSLGKVSETRKRKSRPKDMEDVGEDSESSGFLNAHVPHRAGLPSKLGSAERHQAKVARVHTHHHHPFTSAALPSNLLEDSETTSSTNTAEPRLESTHHQLFCTANSLAGAEAMPAATPSTKAPTGHSPRKSSGTHRMSSLHQPTSQQHQQLLPAQQHNRERLQHVVITRIPAAAAVAAVQPAPANSDWRHPTSSAAAPLLTVAPLFLSAPEAATAHSNVRAGALDHMALPHTWIQRKPTSGPSKALFKRPVDMHT